MGSNRILIVGEVASSALVISNQLELAGYKMQIAQTGAAARVMLMSGADYDAVLLDLELPDCDGLEILAGLTGLAERTRIIVITGHGSIDRAVRAMQLGAHDFLVKPVEVKRLVATIRSTNVDEGSNPGCDRIPAESGRDEFHGFIGGSLQMRAVYAAIDNVASSKATVFITGESGTGKEVAAEAIHLAGKRKDKPFIAINCGAIPEALLESELFGHRKGAFTGAIENHLGAARSANGGTLFLDEICEMDMKLQVKLLRFLQAGLVQPVGASTPEPVDVRVICATNRDPVAEVARGTFREDLFYRLSVIPLHLPPLRERGKDVELISRAFLRRFVKEEGKPQGRFDSTARLTKHNYGWPGNVRELQNAVRRSVVMNDGPMYPLDLLTYGHSLFRPQSSAQCKAPLIATSVSLDADLSGATLDEIERLAIEKAISDSGGNVPLAARKLGVSPSTLYRKRLRWVSHADFARAS